MKPEDFLDDLINYHPNPREVVRAIYGVEIMLCESCSDLVRPEERRYTDVEPCDSWCTEDYLLTCPFCESELE